MKFLIIRFSSIGDIVLTTPVVRSLKQQLINSEAHYSEFNINQSADLVRRSKLIVSHDTALMHIAAALANQ
jgi:ADP-heptose:LPS heptosyltransferase